MTHEEFRVRYMRRGHRVKFRSYISRERAERFAAVLLDPSLERPPDSMEGESYQYDEWIASMPSIEFVRIEHREVGPWRDLAWPKLDIVERVG